MHRRRTLSSLAVAALAGTALLVPSTASAAPHRDPAWSTSRHSGAHPQRATIGDLHWSVLNHEVIVTDAHQGVVPITYSCGSGGATKQLEVSPGVFQKVYENPSAEGFDTAGSPPPSLTCDNHKHTFDYVFQAVAGSFEYGNVEVGLYRPDLGGTPDFEHAIVGYGPKDHKTPVSVTANAAPEVALSGKKITVKGTVKRHGKPYTKKTATLYFQPDGEPAHKIRTDKVDKKGGVSATVTAEEDNGSFFWTVDSTKTTRAGASYGDHILVVIGG